MEAMEEIDKASEKLTKKFLTDDTKNKFLTIVVILSAIYLVLSPEEGLVEWPHGQTPPPPPPPSVIPESFPLE